MKFDHTPRTMNQDYHVYGFSHSLAHRIREQGYNKENYATYSSLNPLTCNILICFTMVLFPDSPAPETRTRLSIHVRHGQSNK